MAIALTKSWNVYRGAMWYQGGSYDTDNNNRNVFWRLKDLLVTTLGWTIIGSCNKSSYNFGGADLWATPSGLNWGGWYSGANSWIVLKHPLYSYQIVLMCIGQWDSPAYVSIRSSWIGYTTGSTSGPDDPGDQMSHLIGTNTDRLWGNNWNRDSRWIAVRSTDGQNTRIFAVACDTSFTQTAGWTIVSALFFEVPTPPSVVYPQWKTSLWPMLVGAWGNNTNGGECCTNYTYLNDGARLYAKTTLGWSGIYLTGEFYGGGALGENLWWPVNDYGNTDETRGWMLGQIKYVGGTFPMRGQFGTATDMWWGPLGCPVGETYSTNGTDRNLVQLGNLVVPWDGGVLNLETA